jgi:nucleotide-binding universal stress UspA family protein
VFDRILIAVNDSEIARHAAVTGIQLAEKLSAELAFVFVVDPSVGYASSTVVATTAAAAEPVIPQGVAPQTALEDERKAGKRVLAEVSVQADKAGTNAVTFMREAKSVDGILSAANEWHADLIVVGTHGRGNLAHMLLGSTSEEILKRAKCPVLLVRKTTKGAPA